MAHKEQPQYFRNWYAWILYIEVITLLPTLIWSNFSINRDENWESGRTGFLKFTQAIFSVKLFASKLSFEKMMFSRGDVVFLFWLITC